MKKALAIVAVAGLTGFASANEITVSEFNGVLEGIPENVPTGGYWNVPGIGSASGGYAIAGSGFVDSNADGLTEVIGNGLLGNTISSSDASGPIGGGQFITQLSLSSSDGELFPTGFSVGGFPATGGGFFLGANAGGTPLNIPGGATVVQALVGGFDSGGGLLYGPFDITGFGNFTAGPGGTWDGSLGVSISNAAGLGTATFVLEVIYTPAPSAMALLGLGGLAATRRRR